MEVDDNTYIPDIDDSESTSVPLLAYKTASLSDLAEDESRRQFFVWQARSERRLIKEFYEGQCGTTYGEANNAWLTLYKTQNRQWGGFVDKTEWELARWLVESNMSQGDTEKFAKLRYVSPKT